MEIVRQNFGEDHPDYAAGLNNLAMLYYELGNYEKAHHYLAQVNEQLHDTVSEDIRSQIAISKSLLAYEEKQYEAIIEWIQPIEQFYSKQDNLDKYPELAYVRALYLLSMGLCALQRPDEAQDYIELLLHKAHISNNMTMQPVALTACAYYLAAIGDTAQAAEMAATVLHDPLTFHYLRRHPQELLQTLGLNPPARTSSISKTLKILVEKLR